eukprot:scaffold8259_cov143-Cylindrotheca_fusiformis.AAC.16
MGGTMTSLFSTSCLQLLSILLRSSKTSPMRHASLQTSQDSARTHPRGRVHHAGRFDSEMIFAIACFL